MTTARKPGKKWYLIAVLIMITGCTLTSHYFKKSVQALTHGTSVYMTVPGKATFDFATTGTFGIWGQSFHAQLPDKPGQPATITIKNIETGKVIRDSDFVLSSEKPRILLDNPLHDLTPGEYSITVRGNIEPHKIELHYFNVFDFLLFAFFGVASFLLAVLISFIMIIATFVKRSRCDATSKIPENTNTEILNTDSERGWAMTCHLSTFAGYIFPFANIIAPLIVWLCKRKDHEYIDQQGKEAINFQLSLSLYYFVAFILVFMLVGIILIPLLMLFRLIATIIASVDAYQGKAFRYPLCIRFIR